VSGYLKRFAFLEREGKTMWTCVHCKTGIVRALPATCPECEKHLTEEVIRAEWKGKESKK